MVVLKDETDLQIAKMGEFRFGKVEGILATDGYLACTGGFKSANYMQ